MAYPLDEIWPLHAADLRTLLRGSAEACVFLHPEGPDFRVLDVTDAYLAKTGTRREQLVGRGLLDVFFPNPERLEPGAAAHLRDLRASLERVVETQQKHSPGMHRYDLADASGALVERHWTTVNRPGFGVDGRLVCIVHQVEDVTEEVWTAQSRQVAEAVRARVDAQLRSVVEQAPVAMAVLRGSALVYEVANARYQELIGHRDVLGRSIREVMPELAGTGVIEAIEGVYTSGEARFIAERPLYLNRANAAQEGVFSWVTAPILDDQGAIDGIAIVAVDVTELVRAREAAERLAAERDAQRRQFETVLEQAPLAIAITAADGQILFSNPTFARLWGHVVRDTTAEAYSDHYRGYHLDGRAIASEEWAGARAVLKGETVEGEIIEIEHASGRRITVWINAAPVRDAEGRIVNGVVMFRDISQERRAEEQLRSTQRLQAAATLAGGVAHEINNQMTAVVGFGEFVLRALGPDHPQAADMRLVLQAGNRAARVSQQLLAFTRQQVMRPHPLDLHAVVTELEPVLQQLLGADKTLTIHGDGAPTVLADPEQVQQVLINLVANARDATYTGAEIRVSLDEVTLDHELPAPPGEPVIPGRYVRITVADPGHGMTPETLERIFDPFFTTKEVGKGSGLGLPMVFGTLRRHGGYVLAHSVPGVGTTMELYWPVATSRAGAPGEASAEPARRDQGGDQGVVVVAEDEPAVRALATRMLEEEGYTVIAGEDGAAALEALDRARVRPDLVLTDVIMPRMNGGQLSAAIHSRWPDVPVLFVSGYTGEGEVVQRLVPSGAPFLQKPFTGEELLGAVAALRRAERRA